MKSHPTHTSGDTACARSMRRDEEGATAYVVAVMIVVLLAFGAIVVDAGTLYAHRRQIQTAADAAALSGVQELPHDPAAATAWAQNYAAINAPHATDANFIIGATYIANDTITAELQDPAVGMTLARFMGIESEPVGARATAVIGSPSTYGSGLMPFGICATGTIEPPYGYEPGQIIELVCDTGDQVAGNWHYVDLTSWTDGENQTKGVISIGGTTDPVSIGDYIDTQTGSPNNPNFSALVDYFGETCGPHDLGALVYDADTGIYEPIHASDGSPCNRMITCPVIIIAQGDPYDWDSVNGTTTTQIVGFLNMFVHNDPDWTEGILLAEFVQVVPVDVFDPGAYTEFGGVMYWLSE